MEQESAGSWRFKPWCDVLAAGACWSNTQAQAGGIAAAASGGQREWGGEGRGSNTETLLHFLHSQGKRGNAVTCVHKGATQPSLL